MEPASYGRLSDSTVLEVAAFLPVGDVVSLAGVDRYSRSLFLEDVGWRTLSFKWAPSWLAIWIREAYKFPTWRESTLLLMQVVSAHAVARSTLAALVRTSAPSYVRVGIREVQQGMQADHTRSWMAREQAAFGNGAFMLSVDGILPPLRGTPSLVPSSLQKVGGANHELERVNGMLEVLRLAQADEGGAAAAAAAAYSPTAAPAPAVCAWDGTTPGPTFARLISSLFGCASGGGGDLLPDADTPLAEVLRPLHLQLGLLAIMLLKRAPLARHITTPHPATSPDRTRSIMRAEMPLPVQAALTFAAALVGRKAANVPGGPTPWALEEVLATKTRAKSAVPVLGTLLPALLSALIPLTQHSHPCTKEPVRDAAANVLVAILAYLPGMGMSLKVGRDTTLPSDLLDTLTFPPGCPRKMRARLIRIVHRRIAHTISRAVMRTARQVLWCTAERALGLAPFVAALAPDEDGNMTSCGSTDSASALVAHIVATLDGMPAVAIEALALDLSNALRRSQKWRDDIGEPPGLTWDDDQDGEGRGHGVAEDDEVQMNPVEIHRGFPPEEDEEDEEEEEEEDEEEGEGDNDMADFHGHSHGHGHFHGPPLHAAQRYLFEDSDGTYEESDAGSSSLDSMPSLVDDGPQGAPAVDEANALPLSTAAWPFLGRLWTAVTGAVGGGGEEPPPPPPSWAETNVGEFRVRLENLATWHALAVLQPLTPAELPALGAHLPGGSGDPYGTLACWLDAVLPSYSRGAALVGAPLTKDPPCTGSSTDEASAALVFVNGILVRPRVGHLAGGKQREAAGHWAHAFLSAEDWGCGLPASVPHGKESCMWGHAAEEDPFPAQVATLAARARLRFIAFATITRYCGVAAPGNRPAVQCGPEPAVPRAPAPGVLGGWDGSLTLCPSLERAAWATWLLQRTIAHTLRETYPLLTMGLVSWVREGREGEPAGPPLVRDVALRRAFGLRPFTRGTTVELKLDPSSFGEDWDSLGPRPPEWVTPALADAAVGAGKAVLAFLHPRAPLSVCAPLVHGWRAASMHKSDDVGAWAAGTDLLPRLARLSSGLETASDLHAAVADTIGTLLLYRPILAGVSEGLDSTFADGLGVRLRELGEDGGLGLLLGSAHVDLGAVAVALATSTAEGDVPRPEAAAYIRAAEEGVLRAAGMDNQLARPPRPPATVEALSSLDANSTLLLPLLTRQNQISTTMALAGQWLTDMEDLAECGRREVEDEAMRAQWRVPSPSPTDTALWLHCNMTAQFVAVGLDRAPMAPAVVIQGGQDGRWAWYAPAKAPLDLSRAVGLSTRQEWPAWSSAGDGMLPVVSQRAYFSPTPEHSAVATPAARSLVAARLDVLEPMLLRLAEGLWGLSMAEWHAEIGGHPTVCSSRLSGLLGVLTVGGRVDRLWRWTVEGDLLPEGWRLGHRIRAFAPPRDDGEEDENDENRATRAIVSSYLDRLLRLSAVADHVGQTRVETRAASLRAAHRAGLPAPVCPLPTLAEGTALAQAITGSGYGLTEGDGQGSTTLWAAPHALLEGWMPLGHVATVGGADGLEGGTVTPVPPPTKREPLPALAHVRPTAPAGAPKDAALGFAALAHAARHALAVSRDALDAPGAGLVRTKAWVGDASGSLPGGPPAPTDDPSWPVQEDGQGSPAVPVVDQDAVFDMLSDGVETASVWFNLSRMLHLRAMIVAWDGDRAGEGVGAAWGPMPSSVPAAAFAADPNLAAAAWGRVAVTALVLALCSDVEATPRNDEDNDVEERERENYVEYDGEEYADWEEEEPEDDFDPADGDMYVDDDGEVHARDDQSWRGSEEEEEDYDDEEDLDLEEEEEEVEEGEEDEEGPDGEDGWRNDLLLYTLTPELSPPAFELLGAIVRDMPLADVKRVVRGTGTRLWARAALVRLSTRCDTSALHNYFFYAGEAASGRIPELTAAIGAAFSMPRVHQNWLAFFRASLTNSGEDSAALAMQAALTAVRLCVGACAPAGWVVAESGDVQGEVGFAPLLVPVQGGAPRAAVDADFVLPEWMTMPPPDDWATWGPVHPEDLSNQPGSRSTRRFAVSALAVDVGRVKGMIPLSGNVPFVEHILTHVLCVVTSPWTAGRVRTGNIVFEEWRALLTGTARLWRAYAWTDSGSRFLASRLAFALSRVGAVPELLRLGWAPGLAPPPGEEFEAVPPGMLEYTREGSVEAAAPSPRARAVTAAVTALPSTGPHSFKEGQEAVLRAFFRAKKEGGAAILAYTQAVRSGEDATTAWEELALVCSVEAVLLRVWEVNSLVESSDVESNWSYRDAIPHPPHLRPLSPDSGLDSLIVAALEDGAKAVKSAKRDQPGGTLSSVLKLVEATRGSVQPSASMRSQTGTGAGAPPPAPTTPPVAPAPAKKPKRGRGRRGKGKGKGGPAEAPMPTGPLANEWSGPASTWSQDARNQARGRDSAWGAGGGGKETIPVPILAREVASLIITGSGDWQSALGRLGRRGHFEPTAALPPTARASVLAAEVASALGLGEEVGVAWTHPLGAVILTALLAPCAAAPDVTSAAWGIASNGEVRAVRVLAVAIATAVSKDCAGVTGGLGSPVAFDERGTWPLLTRNLHAKGKAEPLDYAAIVYGVVRAWVGLHALAAAPPSFGLLQWEGKEGSCTLAGQPIAVAPCGSPPYPPPSALAAALFRLAVCDDRVYSVGNDEGEEGGVGAPGQRGGDMGDSRTAADMVQDGRAWLGGVLWMWRLVETGFAPRLSVP
jgi:hypothetical protein